MKELLDFISNYENFYIFGHRDPDADCICSQLAISGYLRRMGKKTSLFTELPLTRPEISGFGKYFSSNTDNIRAAAGTAAILLDCSAPERSGIFSEKIKTLPYAVIDHHETGIITGESGFIDPDAPSTTALVYRMIKTAGDKPDLFEAELLFLGLCTDTGFFRHLEENSSETFLAASELVNLGVSPNKIYYRIHGNRSVSSRKLLGTILSRTESFYKGKLAVTYETYLDYHIYQKEDRDSDLLYQLLTATAGIEIVASIKEENPGECSVSLRTTGETDLSFIAKHFNGGGHKKASGFSFAGTWEETKEAIIQYFENVYK